MSKTKYTPLEQIPDESVLRALVPDLSYARVGLASLPPEIRYHPLTTQRDFNSFILTSSGSVNGQFYSAIGLRVDEHGTVIDEHPFVYYFEKTPISGSFGAILHHGKWEGRVYQLSAEQQASMSACGFTADITYKDIPPSGSGSLYDLHHNGMLQGVSKQFDTLWNKNPYGSEYQK